MLTLEDLERLSAIESRATRGPWAIRRYDNDGGEINWQVQQEPAPAEVIVNNDDACNPNAKADSALIAEARNALRDLIVLARDAYRFRALVDSLETDARKAMVGSDDDRFKFCEDICVKAAVACHEAEGELGCYCSWREKKLEAEAAELRAKLGWCEGGGGR